MAQVGYEAAAAVLKPHLTGMRSISDPDRSQKHLTVRSEKPFNAEAPLRSLAENDVTPAADFFVRNHLPVPIIDPDLYELHVSGPGIDERILTLDELKALPKTTIR